MLTLIDALQPSRESHETSGSYGFSTSPRSTTSGFLSNQFVRRLTSARLSTSPTSQSSFPADRRPSFPKFNEGPGQNGLVCVHNPPDPLVDLIFVHGLHGGSYKTWRKKEAEGYFWPGEWLPKEAGFERVRIHTFGYPADWDDFKASKLSVNDFGSSLRGNMIGSPYLTRGEKTSIILIGHSMGGLVIKKVRTDAGEDPHTAKLAHRIKCLMFLGTPHHGSDSAEKLDKILRSGLNPVMSRPEFVRDLKREAPSNQLTNDEFKYIAENYLLYSFYESKPTLGGIIVDKDSASIGGPRHEIVQMMEADHRTICKFDDQSDPNYRSLRDHLITVIDGLLEEGGYKLIELLDVEPDVDDLEPLDVYLDCQEAQDENLETILESKVEGTCSWLERRPDYPLWKQSVSMVWFYWLHGPPGTGKSVTSAHVIDQLHSQDEYVSHFFFTNGNRFRRDVASLLRFLAFQMAQKHEEVATAIRELQKAGTHLEDADEKMIWKKLFASTILKMELEPQYWIIDALDECSDFTRLFPLIKSAHSAFPLRIFVTSRTSGEIRRSVEQLRSPHIRVTIDTVAAEDTEADISRLLQVKELEIPVHDDDSRAEMASKIVKGAHGSFLWASIVLKEMAYTFSKEDRERVLEDVPLDMVPHYEGIVGQMSKKHLRKKPLIQTILNWAVCGARPLSVDELRLALFHDINENIEGRQAMQKTIEFLCGQLLIINKHGAVQLVHSTLREFLLSKNTTCDYAVRRDEANSRLCTACLQYLSGPDMRSRSRLMTGAKLKQSIVERVNAFAEYASANFTLHLVRGPADDDEIFKLLVKFLRSPNVLSWIEYVALKFKSLEHIQEAGANLRRFLERRAKYQAPFGSDFETVSSWSADLLRIVSKFGRHILDSPSQMHLLVPPICPRTSSMHTQFASRNPDLHVVGLSDTTWADAISYVEHLEVKPTSMACGSFHLAFGKETGQVRILSAQTCQEMCIIQHGEAVTAMAFDNSGHRLVTSGRNTAKLWDLSEDSSPEELWSKKLGHRCSDFYFSDDDENILVATEDNHVLCLSLNGDDDDEEVVKASLLPETADGSSGKSKPICASFSPDGDMVAVAYPSKAIELWSCENVPVLLGRCGRRADNSSSDAEVESILFNPNSELQYLVVAYKKGEISLIDYETRREVRSTPAEPHSLSSSPDGHTLATADAKGGIQLWDFETLSLLYRINYHSSTVGNLLFSRDGRRLFDIRQTHSVVWEPAALIRRYDEDDNLSTSGTSVAYNASVVPDYDDPTEITAMVTCRFLNREQAIVGKEDGTVSAYDLKTGDKLGELFALTKDQDITHIATTGSLVAGADATKKIVVVKREKEGALDLEKALVTIENFGEQVRQITFSGSGQQLLIAGTKTTQMWQLSSDGKSLGMPYRMESPAGDCWRFFPCVEDRNKFQLLDKARDEFIPSEAPQPRRLNRSTTAESFRQRSSNQPPRIRTAVADPETGFVVVEYEGAKSTRELLILEKTGERPESPTFATGMAPLGSSTQETPTADCYRLLCHLKSTQIRMFLGLYNGKAVYLGPHLWVRTVDLSLLSTSKSIRRKHFFIPHEYIGGNHQVQAMVGPKGEIVFPYRGELAVLRGGEFYFRSAHVHSESLLMP
ncbi:hypothetical protein GQ53DRAFT_707603 [Thozetella sp. PMI_491]|nr:hypothetical protein GQ53DRAFT_707603 [Thozetella sp. PMI_491]